MAHPAACLLAWLIAVIALQYLGWLSLLCLPPLLLLAGAGKRWWTLIRRARWLLLSLWLILAYGTPGEAWRDVAWAPSAAGLDEATLHALRLVLMLGALAWLFEVLPRERLVAGLWAACQPLRFLGVEADRAVVRLALVFDYLEKAPPTGSWRHLLDEPGREYGGPDIVRIELPAWRGRDTGLLLGVAVLMLAGIWLS